MPWTNDPESRRRSSATYGAAWRRARRAQLERDRWRCQLRLPGCQGAASEVDHILGAEADPGHQHLRSVCASCHARRTATQGGGYRRTGARGADPDPAPRTDWLKDS